MLWNDKTLVNRQIYKGEFYVKYEGSMTEQIKQWWIGLGEELEIDIEAFVKWALKNFLDNFKNFTR